MLQDINKIQLRGRIGCFKLTKIENREMLRLSVATNFAYKNREGCVVIETTWFNVVIWDNKFNGLNPDDIKKGIAVEVEGRMRATNFTDNEGNMRTSYEVVANSLTLLDADKVKYPEAEVEDEKMNGDENPFGIPDLMPTYVKLRDFIKAHQGEKGYILTDNSDNDTIYTIVYDEGPNKANEYEVKAVRVNENNDIELLYDDSGITWDDDAVVNAKEYGNYWDDLWDSDLVYRVPTIFNIAEFIREYV